MQPNYRLAMAVWKIRSKSYVPLEEIGKALSVNQGGPIPTEIQQYMVDYAAGKIKKPRGRPRRPLIDDHDDLIVYLYDLYFPWLKKWENRLDKVPSWMKGKFWEGPPSERAARMISCFLRRRRHETCDYRTVLNIVSKTKKRYEEEKAKGTHQVYWRTEVDGWLKEERSQKIG